MPQKNQMPNFKINWMIHKRNPILIMNEEQNERYEESNGRIFYPQYDDNFTGIINYFRLKSNGNIGNVISISLSPCNSNFPPSSVVKYENKYDYFYSQNQQYSWICFDFLESKIIPSHYQIMSYNGGINSYNPKSWVIQGSNDQNVWVNLDEQHDCPFINDANKSHVSIYKNAINWNKLV